MDSFVLSETFKYLYLLFAKPSDLIIDIDHFIFTTEAHLLPLSLARLSNLTVVPVSISGFWFYYFMLICEVELLCDKNYSDFLNCLYIFDCEGDIQ